MARGDQLVRQWRILQILASSRMGKTVAELADELGRHRRTIYRDLEALELAGFPLYTEKVNGKNRWFMVSEATYKIPIPFTLPELIVIYFALDMLRVFKGTVFYEAATTLVRKIKATLPPESVKSLDRLEKSIRTSVKPYKEYGNFREIVNVINKALTEKRSLEIEYYTLSRRTLSRRKVDPYALWFFRGTLYLIGHCHMRSEVRIFAVERIKNISETDDQFNIPEEFTLDKFMSKSLGVFKGDLTRVKIWFSPSAAEYMKNVKWVEGQEIHKRQDGSVIFEAEVEGTQEVKAWVMSWGTEAVVLEPQSLREEIMAELEHLQEAYSRKTTNIQP